MFMFSSKELNSFVVLREIYLEKKLVSPPGPDSSSVAFPISLISEGQQIQGINDVSYSGRWILDI
jgi:hypothetical protein